MAVFAMQYGHGWIDSVNSAWSSLWILICDLVPSAAQISIAKPWPCFASDTACETAGASELIATAKAAIQWTKRFLREFMTFVILIQKNSYTLEVLPIICALLKTAIGWSLPHLAAANRIVLSVSKPPWTYFLLADPISELTIWHTHYERAEPQVEYHLMHETILVPLGDPKPYHLAWWWSISAIQLGY